MSYKYSTTNPLRGNSADATTSASNSVAGPVAASSSTVEKSKDASSSSKNNGTATAVAPTLNTSTTTSSGQHFLLSSSQESLQEASSSVISSTPPTTLSVTRERKEALLQQARTDRLQWIRKVPLPYQQQPQQQQGDDANNNYNDSSTSLWNQDERLRQLKNSHAVQQLPTALTVLSHLYGIHQNTNNNQEEEVKEVGNRVASIIEKTSAAVAQDDDIISDNTLTVVPTTERSRHRQEQQVKSSSLDRGGGGDTINNDEKNGNDPDVLLAYQSFMTHLSDPVCAMLVQGMRSFCRNLKTNSTTTTTTSNNNNNIKDQVVRKLQAYLDSTMESIQQQHGAWMLQQQKQDQNSSSKRSRPEEYVRRSLDSFIYGQCHDFITSLYWDEAAMQNEKEWLDRIDSLQFVNPSHLEIAGLDQKDHDDSDENDDNILHQLLQKPIYALLSVDRYHAPFEKLQRILAVYRGVNAALSTALNQNHRNNTDDDKQQPKRLPSADDVLPTIILTVLKARPERLLVNLQIVEDFLPASHLRAEAGYALTTLHGAVAFIQDFNMDEESSSQTTTLQQLAMDPIEFREGLETCRKAMEEKRLATAAAVAAATTAAVTYRDPLAAVIDVEPFEVYNIPVQEVRSARLRGEVVDMVWALRWQAQQQQTEGACDSTAAKSKKDIQRTSTAVDELTEGSGLPHGFTRNYTFLATRPEDIRMSDLPRLLSEYRMLVQATESLLAERLTKHAAERKAQRMQRQKELYARARQLDPSLIPSSSNNNNSNGGGTTKKTDGSRDS